MLLIGIIDITPPNVCKFEVRFNDLTVGPLVFEIRSPTFGPLILLSSVAPHKMHEAPSPSPVQPIKVFSVYHLHAPPPGRSVPLQWLAPQFGMASLCRSAHSLELFLTHSFLNLRQFYLVVLGLGAPLSSPT